MLFTRKPDVHQVVIYNYDHTRQTMSLIFTGPDVPKKYRRLRKIWAGIDKKRKIKTIILSC